MYYQTGKASRATLITLASFAILITMAVLFLPTGFSNDISKIGSGKKVAVFAYNNGTTNSMDMMYQLEQVRDSYSDKIEFLAVSISAPIGKQFLKDYNVEQSTLVLFDAGGAITASLHATANDKAALIQMLDKFVQE